MKQLFQIKRDKWKKERETNETWQLNAVFDPGLDPGLECFFLVIFSLHGTTGKNGMKSVCYTIIYQYQFPDFDYHTVII